MELKELQNKHPSSSYPFLNLQGIQERILTKTLSRSPENDRYLVEVKPEFISINAMQREELDGVDKVSNENPMGMSSAEQEPEEFDLTEPTAPVI